ncbi:MAG TPA: hypothetical protein PKW37_04090 [Salinivirgaceae bacterium]|nr:hypothetical protein [Salinivirgaceae bacterium]
MGSIFFATLALHHRHTPQLRSGTLRFAPFGAHCGRGGWAVVAKRSFGRHPWLLFAPLNPNKVFAKLTNINKRGQTATTSCARLRVARANRAVMFFALLRSVFLPYPPFKAVVVVFVPHTTTQLSSKQAQHSFTTLRFAPFRSIILPLPQPCKKTTLRDKKTRQPCVIKRRQSAPFSPLCSVQASSVCPPRSTRKRLAPYLQSGMQTLRCATLFAYLLSVGSAQGCFTCVGFLPTHPQKSQAPTQKKQFYFSFICVSRRFFMIMILLEIKEYAKIATPLTVIQGQALRVFEKKSPHLRCASGSIFYQKTLTADTTLLFEMAYPFFLLFFLFSSLFPKKNNCCCYLL